MLTSLIYNHLRKITPSVSKTELTALKAGSSSVEALLFRGESAWEEVLKVHQPKLSDEEKSFLKNEVSLLCNKINDHDINHDKNDIPADIWEYLKSKGFFALQIEKKFGGKGFSPLANSTIVATIASKSVTVAVTVMVPNSLGPAELLQHYGTSEQQHRYLPALASGREIPCFALTSPEAGSDATAIPDEGIICKGEFDGKETLGIKVSWNKRYITLAPVATLIGLAFKCKDPDHLIGDKTNLGITCALIPADLEGVFNNKRHLPCGMKFMNGPTSGQSVFIPIDFVIGGEKYIGKGWQMLVECLGTGRGISLPALSTAANQVSYNSSMQYSKLRKQFGTEIYNFEGIKEPLAKIATNNLITESLRMTVLTVLNKGVSPSVLTAMAKYHMTEMGRESVNHAMDIHAGKAIQCGTDNYLNFLHRGMPIAITVEGANILTRSLMIFGQGSVRCHPYLLDELVALKHSNPSKGLADFKILFRDHIKYCIGNYFSALKKSIFRSKKLPRNHPLCDLVTELDKLSTGYSFIADVALLSTGGDVKRKEHLSGRLGDLLSYMTLMFSLVIHYENNSEKVQLTKLYRLAFLELLFKFEAGAKEIHRNSSSYILKSYTKAFLFVNQRILNLNTDKFKNETLNELTGREESLTNILHLDSADNLGLSALNRAFEYKTEASGVYRKIADLCANGEIPLEIPMLMKVKMATTIGAINEDEVISIQQAESYLRQVISVQSFPMYEKIK